MNIREYWNTDPRKLSVSTEEVINEIFGLGPHFHINPKEIILVGKAVETYKKLCKQKEDKYYTILRKNPIFSFVSTHPDTSHFLHRCNNRILHYLRFLLCRIL